MFENEIIEVENNDEAVFVGLANTVKDGNVTQRLSNIVGHVKATEHKTDC